MKDLEEKYIITKVVINQDVFEIGEKDGGYTLTEMVFKDNKFFYIYVNETTEKKRIHVYRVLENDMLSAIYKEK